MINKIKDEIQKSILVKSDIIKNTKLLSEIENVRIGKHITLEIEAKDKSEASEKVDKACTELLCNQIMEGYKFEIYEAELAS